MPLLTQVIAHVAGFERALKEGSDNSVVAAQATYQNAQWVMLLISSASLLSGIFTAMLLTRSITRPLKEAVQVAQTVAGGDLRSRIEATTRDETGQLLEALKA